MTVLGTVVRHAAFPAAQRLLRASSLAELRALRASEREHPRELHARRDARIAALARWAYDTVPEHRRRFDACGASASRVREAGDLSRLPILTKRDLKAQGPAFHAQGVSPGRHWTYPTSGSTGEPLLCVRDGRTRPLGQATWWHALERGGVHPADAMIDIKTVVPPWIKPWRRALAAASGTRWLMAGPLANRDVAAINAGLRGCRARALIGEPDRLARLGRLVLDGDVRLDVSPVAVFSQGMVMTHDMRATVASAFAAPIHERYAAFEFVPAVAYTCEHGWLHVNEHHFHVEIVSGARGAPHGAAARAGRVLVTDLTNYVAPMLRYEIGDLAEWAPDTACPCGRTWRRLARVIGRQAEVARTASGKEISQSGLARQLFLAVPELPDLVWEYQFQQRAPSEIVLCVVGRPGLGSSHLDAMTRALHEFFRGEVRFEVQVVDEIPVPMGGKRRLLVSSDDHGAWAPSANDFTDVEAPA